MNYIKVIFRQEALWPCAGAFSLGFFAGVHSFFTISSLFYDIFPLSWNVSCTLMNVCTPEAAGHSSLNCVQ